MLTLRRIIFFDKVPKIRFKKIQFNNLNSITILYMLCSVKLCDLSASSAYNMAIQVITIMMLAILITENQSKLNETVIMCS